MMVRSKYGFSEVCVSFYHGRLCDGEGDGGVVSEYQSIDIQGDVAHIYTVGRSATAVKLKINGQFELKLTVKLQYFFDVLSQIGQESSKYFSDKIRRA